MVKSQRLKKRFLRDTEKRLQEELEKPRQNGRRKQEQALPIEEEDIAEVVCDDDGYPCQTDGSGRNREKLRRMGKISAVLWWARRMPSKW